MSRSAKHGIQKQQIIAVHLGAKRRIHYKADHVTATDSLTHEERLESQLFAEAIPKITALQEFVRRFEITGIDPVV